MSLQISCRGCIAAVATGSLFFNLGYAGTTAILQDGSGPESAPGSDGACPCPEDSPENPSDPHNFAGDPAPAGGMQAPGDLKIGPTPSQKAHGADGDLKGEPLSSSGNDDAQEMKDRAKCIANAQLQDCLEALTEGEAPPVGLGNFPPGSAPGGENQSAHWPGTSDFNSIIIDPNYALAPATLLHELEHVVSARCAGTEFDPETLEQPKPLGGQVKSGQSRSGQNRPVGRPGTGVGVAKVTPLGQGRADASGYASFWVRT